MAERRMLAIDLGASSGRGIVGSFDGNKLSLRENHRFSNDPVNLCGRLYWDILRIFHEIKLSVQKTVLDGDKVSSIGIDTWGVDYGLLDRNGRLLGNPVHYRDGRTDGAQALVNRVIPAEELYATAGIQTLNFNTVYQLAVEQAEAPERLALAERMLNIPDLLNYFLTGNMANEYTILSTGALLDAKKRDYAWNLLDRLGIPRRLFGSVVKPGTDMGTLLPQVQSETGKTDARVLTVASHDTASAVIAVPTEEKDFLYISSGTWSLMGTELPEPLINDESRAANFTNEGGACGTVRFLKNIMGLWIIQSVRHELNDKYTFAELCEEAEKADYITSVIDVNDECFLAPENMTEAIKSYCRNNNMSVPDTVGEVAAVVYKSLAGSYADTVSQIEENTDTVYEAIYVIGGGANAAYLNRLTAISTGKKVIAGPVEATAIGNAMAQMITDGIFKNLKEARACVMQSFDIRQFEKCE